MSDAGKRLIADAKGAVSPKEAKAYGVGYSNGWDDAKEDTQAAVAAALEDAAECANRWDEDTLADRIRLLIPTTGTEALERIKEQARQDTLKDVKRIVGEQVKAAHTDDGQVVANTIYDQLFLNTPQRTDR